jgi:hypothetical protein
MEESKSNPFTVELTDFSKGDCISDNKIIPFIRFVFKVIDKTGKLFTFYIYQHQRTKFFTVYHTNFDKCLYHSGWSKTVQKAFHRQQNVINPRGINNYYIAKFTVSPEIIQDIASKIITQ